MVWRLPADGIAKHEAGLGWLGRNPRGRARQAGQGKAPEAPVPHYLMSVGCKSRIQ